MSNRWLSSVSGPGSQGDEVLSLHVAQHAAMIVIEVQGELDSDSVPQLISRTASLLQGQQPPVLVLDLAEVQFFCAAGVRAFIQIRDLVAARGGRLTLRNPSRIVCRVLEITGTVTIFEIDSCAPGADRQRDIV